MSWNMLSSIAPRYAREVLAVTSHGWGRIRMDQAGRSRRSWRLVRTLGGGAMGCQHLARRTKKPRCIETHRGSLGDRRHLVTRKPSRPYRRRQRRKEGGGGGGRYLSIVRQARSSCVHVYVHFHSTRRSPKPHCAAASSMALSRSRPCDRATRKLSWTGNATIPLFSNI